MKRFDFCIALLMLAVPLTARALSLGEGILLDSNTGDYLINYVDVNGELTQSRFVPSTKIVPSLYSRFEDEHGLIHYRYAIKNGITSQQPLIGLTFDPVSSLQSSIALPQTKQEMIQALQQQQNDAAQLKQMVNQMNGTVTAPVGWGCEVIPGGFSTRVGLRIACAFHGLDKQKRNGLQPGKSISGFGFYSPDLPGIEMGQLEGFGDLSPGFTDEGPSGEISDQLDELVKKDFVPRPAAVPMIAVPKLFDAAVLLGSIQTQMHTWIGMKLLDATFSSQLDRYFQSAISSYAHNQPKAGREHIETMRKMLKREHEDLGRDEEHESDRNHEKDDDRKSLIDRLAARVLDFDLDYVLERMEDDHHGRD